MKSPNSVLYKAASDSQNSIVFKPHETGRYSLCFNNPKNTPTTFTFTLITGDSVDLESDMGDPTQRILQEVVKDLRKVKEEQEFLMRREIEHKQGKYRNY
jgi:hypothetical protein